MKYAVIKLQGHQEVVSLGKEIIVDRLENKVGDSINPEVLAVNQDGDIKIGSPEVDFSLELKVVAHQRGEKIYVQKFHAKARYRRRTGFRAEQSLLKVVKFGDEKIEEKSVKEKKGGKVENEKAEVLKTEKKVEKVKTASQDEMQKKSSKTTKGNKNEKVTSKKSSTKPKN